MIIEDGSGIPLADCYITESYFESYCESQGYVLPSAGDFETAGVRGTAWIEAEYGARFGGVPLKGRGQGLHWPAYNAVDWKGNPIPSTEVPDEVKEATAEASFREMVTPFSLHPDVSPSDATGAVKRERLGPLEVEYAIPEGAGLQAPDFPKIDGIIEPVLTGGLTATGGGGGTITLLRA